MPPALTPKVPLTVVANQGTEEMATTVQVRACEVFPTFSLVLLTFYGKQSTLKMFRHSNFRVRFRLQNSPNILFQT